MISSKYLNAIVAVVIGFAMIFTGILIFIPDVLGIKEKDSNTTSFEYETELFNKNKIINLDISIDKDDWSEMLENALAEEYTSCDVTVNGESWGLYLGIEAMEESYAERNFGSNYGKLYKPESVGAGAQKENNGGGGVLLENRNDGDNQQQNNNNKDGMTNNGLGMGGMSSGGTDLVYVDDKSDSYSGIFDNAIFDSNEDDY